MWEVRLLKVPTQNVFRSDFFPRKVAYKKDALELVKEVKEKGGEAAIRKVK